MIDIHIHINNEDTSLDKNVFIEIKLPSVPRIGELIWFTDSQKEELEEQAMKAPNKWAYESNWSAGASDENGLNFESACYVSNVVYRPNSPVVYIELDDLGNHS